MFGQFLQGRRAEKPILRKPDQMALASHTNQQRLDTFWILTNRNSDFRDSWRSQLNLVQDRGNFLP